MPISKDEFRAIDDDAPALPDLSPDTTQGKVYRFLLDHADVAFRQREIVSAVDVPAGSVGPTLKRLEQRDLVDHRDRFWAVADTGRAVAPTGHDDTATVDEVGGGLSGDDVDARPERGGDLIERETNLCDGED